MKAATKYTPKFEDCKTVDERLARIKFKCARYRVYQNDDSDVDSCKAFNFADRAANDYLPWCTREIRKLQRQLAKAKTRK